MESALISIVVTMELLSALQTFAIAIAAKLVQVIISVTNLLKNA
jgi:hypothetical protein